MAIEWLDQLDIRARRMLLADWFAHLARESGLDFQQHGVSGEAFTLGPPDAFHVAAYPTETSPFLKFVASDPGRQDLVDVTAQQAVDHVERSDLGGVVWYSTELHEAEFEFSYVSPMGSFVAHFSRQARVLGWRRLGSNILLEFTEDRPAGWDERTAIFAPKAIVRVHVAALAPCSGFFSSLLAHRCVEVVTAICTLALGRSVALPPPGVPVQTEILPELVSRQTAREIPDLARNHVSLDVFSFLGLPGGSEVYRRLRAAVLAFDAAVRQERDSVACILYVVAAEALTVPETEWRRSKLTKRFIEFFDELMPADLDQTVARSDFEDVFRIRRGSRSARALRRGLLDRIYDYRSGQVHEGLDPNYVGIGPALDRGGDVRRLLFAAFAESAILGYLAAPRVSLVGHPAFERRDPPDECSGEEFTEAGQSGRAV